MARKPVGVVSDGVLSRAARGEGAICPRCRTFAPMGVGGVPVCTSCGGKIIRGDATPAPRVPKKGIPRARVPVPGKDLGNVPAAEPFLTVSPAPVPEVPLPASEPVVEKASEPDPEPVMCTLLETLDDEPPVESKKRRR